MEAKTQKCYIRIKTDMLNLKWLDLPEDKAIDMIFSRIKWENDKDEKTLRIATQNNLDCIIRIEDNVSGKKNEEKRIIKVISISKVDN